MDAATADTVLLVVVVVARFVVPLFIPAYPLPAVVLCLLLDGADREILVTFTDLDLSRYQGTDKALDIFYLTVAMLAVLRNWTHAAAARTARFLYYLRLLGVAAFELTGWRPFLLLLPNAFEYFFIFYEAVRSRWSPDRLSARSFLVAAGVIWVGVKLPQEYWLHVLRIDITELLKDAVFGVPLSAPWAEAVAARPGALVALLAATVAVALAVWMAARAFVPEPEHRTVLAAGPFPESIDEARERARFLAAHWRVVDLHLVEKIVLVSLVTVVFAQVMPRLDATPVQLTLGVAVIVTFNSFLTLRQARRGRTIGSVFRAFALLGATNVAFGLLADLLLRRLEGGLHLATTLFFLLLLTLVVTLYDRWRPVYDVRFAAGAETR